MGAFKNDIFTFNLVLIDFFFFFKYFVFQDLYLFFGSFLTKSPNVLQFEL